MEWIKIHITRFSQFVSVSQLSSPQWATDYPSTPVSYWQHSGLLKKLGLLCCTKWHLCDTAWLFL